MDSSHKNIKQASPDLSAPLSGGTKKYQPKLPTVAIISLVMFSVFVLLHIIMSWGSSGGDSRTPGVGLKKIAAPPTTVLFKTKHGDLRIELRQDLAPESVEYIEQIVEGAKCERCNFYRSEKDLLLQGVMETPLWQKNIILGKCPIPPDEYKPIVDCPVHDKSCGCHGPMMTRGMVGWAGGGGGPDFFIVTYKKPVDFWDHWHTVWGELDEESIAIVEKMHTLPSHKAGMVMLDEKIQFIPEFA